MAKYKPRTTYFLSRITHCFTPCRLLIFVVIDALAIFIWATVHTVCFSNLYLQDPLDYVKDLTAVPKFDRVGVSRFRWHIEKGVPFHATDMLHGWEATKKWTPQFFSKQYGEIEIQVQSSNPESAPFSYTIETNYSDYVKYMDALKDPKARDDANYILLSDEEAEKVPDDIVFYHNYATDLLEDFDELWNDVNGLDILARLDPYLLESVFWLGPEGSVTGLHREDDPVNVLFQIYGTKKVTLIPPSHTPYLYPSRKYSLGAQNSPVKPSNLDDFPLMKQAKQLTVTLEAGQLLFIPVGWWHMVETISESISISGRTFSYCQRMSYYPQLWIWTLHNMGLYRSGDCSCHGQVKL